MQPFSLLWQGEQVCAGEFAPDTWEQTRQAADYPLISCLMPTARRPDFVRCAVQCFQRQNYPRKELIILDHEPGSRLESQLRQLDDPRIRYYHHPESNPPIGTLRNRCVELASGDYIATWDDDDLFHPQRLSLQMAILQASRADACLLSHLLLWWPKQRRLALSVQRGWEASLLCARGALPAYPPLRREEDVYVTRKLFEHQRVVLLDKAELYLTVRSN